MDVRKDFSPPSHEDDDEEGALINY